MKNAIVGYTGFVGGNIYLMGSFDGVYNSQNIQEAYGTNPELLIYSGLRAEKYLANNEPEKDLKLIVQAEDNISRISPERLVLISTIDVFKSPKDVDEETNIVTEDLHAYGLNRYRLEEWVRDRYPNALIVRLPGLFGNGIKKNFIYDYMNVIPYMLRKDKYMELAGIDQRIKDYYELLENGFYRANIPNSDRERIKKIFKEIGFTALDFTDSRSSYQFYDLSRLWKDINIALDEGLKLLHMATEPVTAGEVYYYLTGNKFVNELPGIPADYDYRTKYAELFGGHDGYIMDKDDVLRRIKIFVEANGKGV